MSYYSLSFFKKACQFILIIFLLSSCKVLNVTKKISDNESILQEYNVYLDGKKINNEDLNSYIKQKPKKKFFGLFRGKNIYSPVLTEQSKKQIHYYFFNKSYFNNTVSTEIKTKRKRTTVNYYIKQGNNFPVAEISYKGIKDDTLKSIIKENAYIDAVKIGENYDFWKLNEERNYIEKTLLDNGYFSFKKDNVHISIDTLAQNKQVKIEYQIYQKTNSDSSIYKFNKFTFDNIYIQLMDESTVLDTTKTDYINIIKGIDKDFPIKEKILKSNLLFKKGDIYSRSIVDKSYSKLNALNVFEQIRINLNRKPNNLVDIIIEVKEKLKFSTTYDLEGIHQLGDLGLSANIGLEKRNVFKGGETLNFSIYGSIRGDFNSERKDDLFLSNTYGAKTKLRFPKFLAPISTEKIFSPLSNVNTAISLNYERQKLPIFGKTELNSSLNYNWNNNTKFRFSLKPITINFTRIDDDSDLTGISGFDIINNYSNYFVTATSFGFVYNDQNPKKTKDINVLISSIEFSGNILNTFGKLTKTFKTDDQGIQTIFGNQFSQYLKLDVDYRHFFVFNKLNSIGVRFLSGLGLPYGNSKSLPLNKQYYIGGSNDIRAFPSLKSEPGSYNDNDSLNYSADIKLELNAEYRFPIHKSLRGAIFMDVGNIWDIKDSKDKNGNAIRPDATFKISNFFNQLYIGTGLGIRFDMDIAVIRVDFGYPVYDPTLGHINPNYDKTDPNSKPYLDASNKEKWMINQPFEFGKIRYNLGIGYPF